MLQFQARRQNQNEAALSFFAFAFHDGPDPLDRRADKSPVVPALNLRRPFDLLDPIRASLRFSLLASGDSWSSTAIGSYFSSTR